MNGRPFTATLIRLAFTFAAVAALSTPLMAQDRLQEMPGFDRYEELRPQLASSFISGALRVTWADDGRGFTYNRDGRSWRYDLATGAATDQGAATQTSRFGRGGPARGR